MDSTVMSASFISLTHKMEETFNALNNAKKSQLRNQTSIKINNINPLLLISKDNSLLKMLESIQLSGLELQNYPLGLITNDKLQKI